MGWNCLNLTFSFCKKSCLGVLAMLNYIMRHQTGLDWSKPVTYNTWRKKSRTAGWLPGECGVSMAMPSCRHSACSCWNSTSETYCLSRSLVMFTHSWNARNTHTHTSASEHTLQCPRHEVPPQRHTAVCLFSKHVNAHIQSQTQLAVAPTGEVNEA